jgi:hypothetical protein
MGSTVCVRCGATLIPHSYCDVCQDVLRSICSSCSMYTDDRIHAYCCNTDIRNSNDVRRFAQIPHSSQIVLDDDLYVNNHTYVQSQLSDEIKNNSINLFASYSENIFESIRLVNGYWSKIFKKPFHD